MIPIRAAVVVSFLSVFAFGCVPALAQDEGEPAKDHPSVPRFPGMAMESGRQADFDAFEFDLGDGSTKHVEGKLWQMTYQVKPGSRPGSPLEIIRNYGNQFKARGGKIVAQSNDGGTMMMPLGAGERWLRIDINNGGEQILMAIVETAVMKQKVEFSADEMAEQMAATGKIALHGILFDTGKTEIKPESNPLLDEVAGMIGKDASLKFRVEGHTDNVGAKPANLTLSRGRAAAVRSALVSRGVGAERLTSEGFGDTKPVADNGTAEGRTQNRRVELVKQ